MADYRDKLRILLEELHEKDGMTRYRISKMSGISEQTLSNVMHKRRNLSIEALEKLLDSIGYEVQFSVRTGPSILTNEIPVASTGTQPEIGIAIPGISHNSLAKV